MLPWPWRGLPVTARCGDALCTVLPHLVDDVTFSYHGASGPTSRTTLCFRVGRQTTAVFGRVNAALGAKSAMYNSFAFGCVLDQLAERIFVFYCKDSNVL